MRDGLEDLLVAPARLAGLLVDVKRRRALALDQRLDEAQENGLTLVVGVELARERDLVEPEPGLARRALQGGERVLALLMLRDGKRDPLLRGPRQGAVAQLRAEAGVRAQRRGRSRQHADEVRKLASAGERPLQDRETALGRSQLVMDLEPALLRLHRASLSTGRLSIVSIGKWSAYRSLGNTHDWGIRMPVESAGDAAIRPGLRGQNSAGY